MREIDTGRVFGETPSIGRFSRQKSVNGASLKHCGLIKGLSTAGATLANLLDGYPSAPAVSVSDGPSLTRRELSQVVSSLVNQLSRAGCSHGDVIAIVLDNSVAFIATFLAVASLGAIAAPIGTELTFPEYVYSYENTKPRMVIISEGSAENAAARAATSTGLELSFISEDALDKHIEVVFKTPKQAPISLLKRVSRKKVMPEDFALILQHTEGTSASSPSAFVWTHENILAGARATAEACQITSEDRNFVCMPMYHTQGLLYSLIPSLATGGGVVISHTGKFSAESFWSTVAEESISYTIMVPATASLLLRHTTDWELAGRPVLSFLVVSCGAGLLSASVRKLLETSFGTLRVLEALGLTETATFVACNTLQTNIDDGSTGKGTSFGRPSLGVQVSVRDAEGAEGGATGILYISGPAVSPAQIRGGKIITSFPGKSGIWLKLPRQGCIDSSGNITATADSTVINQGGNKLDPAEAIAALEGLPAVDQAAVFGVEHALMGQVVGVALQICTPGEVITNEDVCIYMSTSQRPLPARWLPSCTVLVQSEHVWPLDKAISEFAEAFGLPVFSGRSNETFFYSASAGLTRFEPPAATKGDASGISGKARLSDSSVSLLTRADQELFALEDAVTKSYATILGDTKALDPDSNFFDYGASLHVLALLAEIKRLTEISLSQTDVFIRPTIKQLAACLLLKKQEAAGQLGGTSVSLGPPPVVHLQELETCSEWHPASYGQEQMCLANEQSGAGAAYNMPYCVKLSGALNVRALHAAILSTIRAEGGLRTLGRLNCETVQAEQRVIPAREAESCLEFLEHTAQSDSEALEIVHREQAYIFDLEHGPIVRVNLTQVSPKLHYVLINFHHLNIDGWSQALHRHQVLEAYVAHATAASEKRPPPPDIPTHRITYLDFSVWQRKWLEAEGAAEKQLEYWKKELEGAPMLDMPFDRRRTVAVSQNGGKVHVHIPAKVVNAWRKLLASHGCTLFMGSLAVFHVLLHRWSGQSDIIIGAATANRGAAPQLPNMIGQFANELAIRCDLRGKPTYSELLERVRTKILAAWAAQDVPFHEVVAALDLPRVAGANPIFQSFFALQETSWHIIDVDTTVADNLQAEIVRIETRRSKFSVHLMLRERPDGGLDGDLLYPTDLWEHATAERMGRHYETLVASAVEHARDVPVGALQMLPPEEQHMVQVQWNILTSPSPPFPILQRIETQIAAAAAKNPSATALEDNNGRKMTYGELIEQSSAMAAHLGGHVLPGDPVALAFKGEIEMVVGVLSTLMAGAIYVPIDVDHTPTARMQAMLEDSKPKVFLLMDRYRHLENDLKAMKWPITFIYYQDIHAMPLPVPLLSPSLTASLSPDSLAGLFYTSGSTGAPKGVMISHANVHNLIHWWARLMALGPEDKCLHFSSYSFIMSLRQMIPTLCTGATLVLPVTSIEFENAISQCSVTKIALTPSALATVDPEATPSLKRVQVAGEAPTLALAKQWSARLEAFYIGLGPTELSAHACTGLFPEHEDTITIGTPVSNAAVYIVNDDGQIQSPGIIGELWVAGENVAMGYLNKPDLNAHSFITNPFDNEKTRLYRTGDLARRLPDGRVKFEGRKDAQVKIRGFRVEMREISEVILDSTPKLQHAEVMLLGSQLVAFVTPSLTEDEHTALRQTLQRQLQDYMIPGQIIDLEAFPLNKNGKLNRQELVQIWEEAPGRSAAVSATAPPSTPMQLLVQSIWAEILGSPAEQLDNNSNFFEVGGTSLYAILAMRRAGVVLNCHVPATLAFSAQTIGEQAAALEGIAGNDFQSKLPKGSDGTKSGSLDKQAPLLDFRNISGSPLPQGVFTTLQVTGIILVVAVGAGPAGAALALCLYLILGPVGFPALPILPFIWMVATLVHLLAAFFLKYVFLGGKLRPGVYHIYSTTFLKWWLLRKLLNVTRVWLWYLNQTPFISAAYRLLGANIGKRVTLDDAVLEDLDLITIENDTFLQPFASIIPGEVFGNALVLQPVHLRSHTKLEPRAAVLGGGTVASGCIVKVWSAVTALSPVQNNLVLQGSPAQPASPTATNNPKHVPEYTLSLPYALGQLVGFYVLILVNILGLGTTMAIARTIAERVGGFESGVYCFVAFFLPLFLVVILLTIALKWILLGRDVPGQRNGAWYGYRMWLVDRLLMSPILRMAVHVWTQEVTTYHLYLRALGAKIGSHLWWNRPWVRSGVGLLSVGNDFHGGMMGLIIAAIPDAEGVTFHPVTIGNSCTMGQRAVAMPGVELGDNVTVGAEGALYSGARINTGCTVFGSPPTVFASSTTNEDAVRQLQAEVAAEEGRVGKSFEGGDSKPEVARTPGLVRFALMLASIAVYPAIGAIYGLFYYLIVWIPLRDTVSETPGWLALLVPAVYCAGTLAVALLVALLARLGIADFRAGSTPFYTWSFFSWCIISILNDLCSGLLLYPIAGTWLYTSWLKLVGATVGKGTFVAPHGVGFREINHMEIGNGALVLSSMQGHFLDHNALQFGPCKLGQDGRLNIGASLMPTCSVGDGATLRAVATTVKGQKLVEGKVYLGSPAAVDKIC